MPVVVVHGVNVRQRGAMRNQTLPFIRQYIEPLVSAGPGPMPVIEAYWGDNAVRFFWNLASVPEPLAGMGAERPDGDFARAMAAAGQEPEILRRLNEATPASGGRLTAMGPGAGLRLSGLSVEELAAVAEVVVRASVPDEKALPFALIAADLVVHEPGLAAALAVAADSDAEAAELTARIQAKYEEIAPPPSGLAPMGPGDLFAPIGDFFREVARGATGVAGDLVTLPLASLLRPQKRFIAQFIGDVFFYLEQRGVENRPGVIPGIVLTALREARVAQLQRNGEPIIVLTHSFGGQIIYDIVTSFLMAANPENIRIDFWAATASQVAIFEEMKLFVRKDFGRSAQAGNKMLYPDRSLLGVWWNVWDSHDFASFSARDIFEDVADWEFKSHLPFWQAHGGYLESPAFYREFAERIKAAKAANWGRP